MVHELWFLKHDQQVIHMQLYNKEQVQDAINGLSTNEACTQVLSFMGPNLSDGGNHLSSGGDEQSSRKGSSGKKSVSKTSSKGAKGRASKASTSTSSTSSKTLDPVYPVFDEEVNNICDFNCKM